MDLVGPLPETKNGNKYLLDVTCYYTKWAESRPIPRKNADS